MAAIPSTTSAFSNASSHHYKPTCSDALSANLHPHMIQPLRLNGLSPSALLLLLPTRGSRMQHIMLQDIPNQRERNTYLADFLQILPFILLLHLLPKHATVHREPMPQTVVVVTAVRFLSVPPTQLCQDQ